MLSTKCRLILWSMISKLSIFIEWPKFEHFFNFHENKTFQFRKCNFLEFYDKMNETYLVFY